MPHQQYLFCIYSKIKNDHIVTIRCNSNYLYINGVNLRDLNIETKNKQLPIKEQIKITSLDKEFLAVMLRKKIDSEKAIITQDEFLKLLLKHSPEKNIYKDIDIRNRLNNVSSRINKLFHKIFKFEEQEEDGLNSQDNMSFISLYGIGKKSLHPNIDVIEINKNSFEKDIKNLRIIMENIPEYIQNEINEFKKIIEQEEESKDSTPSENFFLEKLSGKYYIFELSYVKKDKIERIPVSIEKSGYVTRKSPTGSLYKGQLTITNTILNINLYSENAFENVYMTYDISLLLVEHNIKPFEMISGITLALTSKNEPIARGSILVKRNDNDILSSEQVTYLDVKHENKTNNYFHDINANVSIDISENIIAKLRDISKGEILRVTS